MSLGSETFLVHAMDNKFYLYGYRSSTGTNNMMGTGNNNMMGILDFLQHRRPMVYVFSPGTPKPWSAAPVWKYAKRSDIGFFTCQISEMLIARDTAMQGPNHPGMNDLVASSLLGHRYKPY